IFFCLFFIKGFSNNPLGGWLMYFGKVENKNANYFLNYDVQLRNHVLSTFDLNQLLVRGSANYTLFTNLSIGAGYAYVLTEKFDKPDHPFIENRIFQDVVTNQKIENTSLRHRFRFEQRFIENQDFKSRLRYQL